MAESTRNESVLELLRAYPGEPDPIQVIRGLARERLMKARAQGWSGPPFCPKELCSIFDIRCREVTHDIGGDGRLLLRRGQLWIEYHADRLPERKRFTIFHEFAHTLFPDYCEFLPLYQATSPATLDPEREFEDLCDSAAAEMLFPREEFLCDLAARKVSLAACYELSGIYQASIDATLRRVLETDERTPCCAAFLTDVRGNREGNGPLWVKYIIRSKGFRGFVWPGTTPPDGSVALRCLNGVDRVPLSEETWTSKGKSTRYLAEAAKLPSIPAANDYPKVVVLVYPAS